MTTLGCLGTLGWARRTALLGMASLAVACGSPQQGSDAGADADASTSDVQASDAGLDARSDGSAIDTGTTVPDGSGGADVVDVPQDTGPVCFSTVPSDGGVTDAGASEAGADAGAPGETYTYVVSQLAVDRSFNTSRYGFNLDTFGSVAGDTSGCGKMDTFSRLDSDQHVPSGCAQFGGGCRGGVDNQIPELLDHFSQLFNIDVASQVEGQVPYHRMVVLFRLKGVNDFVNDSDVTLQVYEGYATYNTNCTSVLPNREYQVALSSLMPGGTTLDDAKFSVRGQIVDGRFQAQALPASVLDLPLRGLVFPLTLRINELRVRFDIASTGGTRGNLGGFVYGDELYTSVPMAFRPIVDDFIFDSVDLPVNNICAMMNPARFGAVSLGLGFSLAPARIASTCTVTNQAMAGVCGTTGNP